MIPVRDNILVRPLDADNVSEGGIFVPDSFKAVSNKVLIVAVGGGTPKKPMRLNVGQTGYRVKDWGNEVFVNGEKHYIMNQDAIIAIE